MTPKILTRDEDVLLSKLDKSQPVFADTETIGFYGKIRLLQVYQEGWDEVIMLEYPKSGVLVKLATDYHTIWHNSHYDLTTIQENLGGMPLPFKDFDDTFLLARLALPQYLEYSLDAVMTVVHRFDPYKNAKLDKHALQKSNWSVPVLSEDQLEYAAIDVYYLPKVWHHVKHAMDTQSYQLDKSMVKISLQFQWNGMPVDNDKLEAKYTSVSAELATIPMPINANSWQQVRKWLNVDESDDKFLAKLELRDGNERAASVRKVRKLRKQLSFLEKYDVERVVGKFKPSARSGRFTSNDENLQQVPRKLKEVFGYPEDSGRTLIYSDYAQLELRTICAILGVSLMEKLFRDGVDLHGYVAEILFGKDYTPKDRQVTKTYNFNLLYGGSVGMVLSILITYGFWLDERTASGHKRKWLNVFREINKWQQECIAKWKNGKLNSTPLGREYKAKLMTDFMNIMNQGAGAEVAKLALHYFYPKLVEFNKEHDTDVKLCNFIHDAYILDSPDDPAIYEPIAKILAECKQQAWFEMSKLFKIHDLPMPIEVKVGRNWGDLEEGENVLYKYELKGMEMYNNDK